jgi:hypothetical protein
MPMCTIQKFLERAPSWWSNARAVLAAVAVVGPNSDHPDPSVVARLESKEEGMKDLRVFLETRVAARRNLAHA